MALALGLFRVTEEEKRPWARVPYHLGFVGGILLLSLPTGCLFVDVCLVPKLPCCGDFSYPSSQLTAHLSLRISLAALSVCSPQTPVSHPFSPSLQAPPPCTTVSSEFASEVNGRSCFPRHAPFSIRDDTNLSSRRGDTPSLFLNHSRDSLVSLLIPPLQDKDKASSLAGFSQAGHWSITVRTVRTLYCRKILRPLLRSRSPPARARPGGQR